MNVAEDLEQFCEEAKKLGALAAKVICPKDVVTGQWVRLKCQFGCGGYGERLTCPPYSPTPQETREMLDGFEYGILIHSRDWHELKKIVAKLEQMIFLAGYHKAFGMGSGPCDICTECALEDGCRHPDEARPAMEACGIDVFTTVRKQGFGIEVLTSPEQQANYFGLVLVE